MSRSRDLAAVRTQPATTTLGTSNYRAGVNAGNSIVSGGNYNVAVGDEAGTAITTGDQNTFVGYAAGDVTTTSSNNTGIGNNALGGNILGSYNVAIGKDSLEEMNPASAVNMYNTAVGAAAGQKVSTGVQNTIIGGLAGDALTTGQQNTVLGYGALTADTTGITTVAIGRAALEAQNFTGGESSYNTAVGYHSGLSLTTGTANTFIGALTGDGGAITGTSNTACGYAALTSLTTSGYSNTGLGKSAGSVITTGHNNIGIGDAALNSGRPGGAITTGSNVIGLGNADHTEAHIQIDWTVASDARDKTDFTALDLGLDFVKALAPVTYKWDKRSKYGDNSADDYDLNAQSPDGTHKEDWLDIGFKAQEVQVLEEAAGYKAADKKNLTVSTSGDGKQMGLQYSKFVPILVKAIQEQNALIEALTARVATLEG